jgi:hypothetical protein
VGKVLQSVGKHYRQQVFLELVKRFQKWSPMLAKESEK